MADFVDASKMGKVSSSTSEAGGSANKDNIQIVIHNKEQDKYFLPAIADGVDWQTEWKGAPGRLSFSIYKSNDDKISFAEGDEVMASFNGKKFFYGFVFTTKRDKNGKVNVVAYDQIRYLKNKAVYLFVDKTAGDIIKQIAEDFQLKVGDLCKTDYVIPKKRSSNESMLDLIQDVINMTTENETITENDADGNQTTKNALSLFCLYDEAGKLNLKRLEDMQVDILIDGDTAKNFTYNTSIDKDTYNQVKLYYEDKETGKRAVYLVLDSANQKRWGVLQLCEQIDPKKPINFKEMAEKKLALHNQVKRTLSVNGAFGDIRVRGGSMLWMNLDLGDLVLTKQMIVKSCKHKFSNSYHTMDLTVIGDVING